MFVIGGVGDGKGDGGGINEIEEVIGATAALTIILLIGAAIATVDTNDEAEVNVSFDVFKRFGSENRGSM